MLSVSECAQRRASLLASLKENSMCIVAGANLVTRSRDTEYAFRQNSDFFYLTGFNEPNAMLVMSNSPDIKFNSILFCQDKDELAEIWQGRRYGPKTAQRDFLFDAAYAIDDLTDSLAALMDGHDHLYFAQGEQSEVDELIFDTLQTLRSAPKQSRIAPPSQLDIRLLLHEMRLFKSENEIALMQKAADISCEAHSRAMRFAADGKFEYQLEAEILHEFAMQGARNEAYATIVGGGENACVLHYTENSDSLNEGELVLIDAGAEYQGYAADITRTFPVSGTFSEAQKVLYNIVLDAQLQSMQHLKPGSTIAQATNVAVEVITQGLVELGILSGSVEHNIKEQTYRQYFMHGLGHWLGLDVHDVGDYKIEGEDRPLRAGMVLTVEPGIYIAKDAEVDEKWQGIGIRIEDNVLITQDYHRVLTSAVPKTVEEIEALMQGCD